MLCSPFVDLLVDRGFTALISGLTGNLSDISDNLIVRTDDGVCFMTHFH